MISTTREPGITRVLFLRIHHRVGVPGDPVMKVLRDPKYIHGPDEALIDAWHAAMNSESAEAKLERSKRSFRLTFRPTRRLAIAYKTFFLFVRAYQDALCCLLNNSNTGSMESAFKKKDNPVRMLLDAHAPAYVAWFPESGRCVTRSSTALARR